MNRKIIIEMSYMEQLVSSKCVDLLSGQDIIVLYTDLTMSIELFKALTTNKITAYFERIDVSSDDKSQIFKFGFLLGSLRQDILLIGKMQDFTISSGEFSVTLCDNIKNLPRLLNSEPAKRSLRKRVPSSQTIPSEAQDTQVPKKRGRKSKSVEATTSNSLQRSQDTNTITKPKRSDTKQKTEEIPALFAAKLKEIGITKLTNNFDDTSFKIFKAVRDSMTDITLDMQLRINLLDSNLYEKVFPIIQSHYQELKDLLDM